ncbi:MAG: Eco57I restriction-modification methylase domain-containing protein [Candidatus Sumerlaeia bacterium]|nr:Eco57I restriction-modification methylase domain-containing protein [Candidatus Sumerlaeia bacterium]
MIAPPIEIVSSLELRRQDMQLRFDVAREATDRNRLGQFATPNPLAIEIARLALETMGEASQGLRFADPSIGTGSFYSALLQVAGLAHVRSAVGVELDPELCALANELWSPLGLRVIRSDFTRLLESAGSGERPNLILANPPYVRHHHLGREEKARLRSLVRRELGVEVSGLSGLYVYFLLLATAWMEEQGVAAWLIPSEFMDVNYGAPLKEFLLSRTTLLRVHRFDPREVQFGDALVSSVVILFRKEPPPTAHEVHFTFGGSLRSPGMREQVGLTCLRSSRKWTEFPRAIGRATPAASGAVLGDFFQVQRGIATGANKFFILTRERAAQLALPSQHLKPILPSPRNLKVDVVEADTDGNPLLDPQLLLVDCDLPEDTVRAKWPAMWEYFQTPGALDAKARYLSANRSPWYRQERRAPAPYLCTYMGRGSDQKRPLRFIWNRSRAIGTNLYLMLYPKPVLASLMGRDPGCEAEAFRLLLEVTGHELRSEGRVYGGGLHKIEPSELARISADAFLSRWPELGAACARQGELFADPESLTGT